MQRRKFVLGVGSLAAGGAATMGTGALSSTEAERGVRGTVASDQSAYLSIVNTDETENAFAIEQDGAEFVLTFDGDGDVAGQGLPADAVSFFDDAFAIRNRGKEELYVWIEESLERVSFYEDSAPDIPLTKSDPAVIKSVEGNSLNEATQNVGVRVDTTDVVSGGSILGQNPDADQFNIVATDDNPN